MNQIVEIRKNGGTGLLGVLIVWGLAVAAAAEAGVYRAIYPLGLACLIALGIVAPVAVYSMSRGVRTYIATIGLRTLTAFHIWRIAAALVFLWYPYASAGLGPATRNRVLGILAWTLFRSKFPAPTLQMPARRAGVFLFVLVDSRAARDCALRTHSNIMNKSSHALLGGLVGA
ncbi:hypothetical protein DPV79_03640 [Burkholderia reimsis]|uniref:Uncharacterized protein n=1 Tax=Burkholderia reimsis TaxID=2234132 RepID=A0A365R1D8_9BURK|nr:hypothetical protein [Burkholderia reimsis]RBB42304.1 hypothetical protein DPV79_03640 [Burkholderia reimsis]